MLKYYSSYLVVFGGVAHLICCGIPLILGVSSFISNFSVSNILLLDFEFLEIAESYLLAFTSLLLLTIISSEIYNKKVKCVEENECCEVVECNSKQKKIKFNIYFSSFLYVINLSLFLTEKI